MTRTTSGQYAKAKRMWAEGATSREIAAETGLTADRVRRIARKHRDDFPYRNVRIPRGCAKARAMLVAHERGATYAQIAKAFGISVESVRRICYRERDAA